MAEQWVLQCEQKQGMTCIGVMQEVSQLS